MNSAQLLDSLKSVNYPGFSRDIVSFGLVNEAIFESGKAIIKLVLTSSDPKLPVLLKAEIEKKLSKHAEISEKEISIVVKKQANGASEEANDSKVAGIKRIIAIASGKGGVGKSTLTANLGCAISRLGEDLPEPIKVGLMDCDVYGPSLPLLMGSNERPQLLGENLLAPNESFGIKLMSMGLLIDEDSPVVWRGPMVMKTIQQFAANVEWGELDYLLIDLPPGTGDAQLSLAQTLPLDGAIIVTTPQKAAVDVARRGARMFEKVNVPILGVIENMSYLENPLNGNKDFLFGNGGGEQTAKDLQTEFLGMVPLNQEVREGAITGYQWLSQTPNVILVSLYSE